MPKIRILFMLIPIFFISGCTEPKTTDLESSVLEINTDLKDEDFFYDEDIIDYLNAFQGKINQTENGQFIADINYQAPDDNGKDFSFKVSSLNDSDDIRLIQKQSNGFTIEYNINDNGRSSDYTVYDDKGNDVTQNYTISGSDDITKTQTIDLLNQFLNQMISAYSEGIATKPTLIEDDYYLSNGSTTDSKKYTMKLKTNGKILEISFASDDGEVVKAKYQLD